MSVLAMILDDTPQPWQLFLLCVYLPALTTFLSWLLIRWKRKLNIAAGALCVIAALDIIQELKVDLARDEAIRRANPNFWPYHQEYSVAAWFAAGFPFVMIALFSLASRKEPKQSPELTAPNGPRSP